MCIFCEIVKGNIPGNIVYEDDKTIAFLDLSQTTKGHTLVVSKTHCTNILDCDEETLQAMTHTVSVVSKLLVEKLGASGINVLSNANEAAGQTVMHFHIHLIPRYSSEDGFEVKFTENQTDLPQLLKQITE